MLAFGLPESVSRMRYHLISSDFAAAVGYAPVAPDNNNNNNNTLPAVAPAMHYGVQAACVMRVY